MFVLKPPTIASRTPPAPIVRDAKLARNEPYAVGGGEAACRDGHASRGLGCSIDGCTAEATEEEKRCPGRLGRPDRDTRGDGLLRPPRDRLTRMSDAAPPTARTLRPRAARRGRARARQASRSRASAR